MLRHSTDSALVPAALLLCLATLALAGCAGYGTGRLRAGEPAAEVVADMGPPTGRYPRPEGGERLEFARGPFGKHTFMVDLGPDGKVQRWDQVLREDVFYEIRPGMRSDELRYRLGR